MSESGRTTPRFGLGVPNGGDFADPRRLAELAAAAEASGTAGIEEWVEERIAARAAARVDGDFTRADAIRDELLNRGVALEDGPSGTRWKLVSQAD